MLSEEISDTVGFKRRLAGETFIEDDSGRVEIGLLADDSIQQPGLFRGNVLDTADLLIVNPRG
jgi:hypothetical protein